MCRRFAQKSSARKVSKQFKVGEVPPLVERYNVAPAQRGAACEGQLDRGAVC
jgi:putative SOS response-associated peptidase YedK